MTYYDEQLQRLQAQTARAKQLESMLRELRGQQAALSARVQELEAVKRKEQVDVDRLEGRITFVRLATMTAGTVSRGE